MKISVYSKCVSELLESSHAPHSLTLPFFFQTLPTSSQSICVQFSKTCRYGHIRIQKLLYHVLNMIW